MKKTVYISLIILYVLLLLFIGNRFKGDRCCADVSVAAHVDSDDNTILYNGDSLAVICRDMIPESPMLAQSDTTDNKLYMVDRYAHLNGNIMDNESKELPVELLIRNEEFNYLKARFNGDSTVLALFRGKMDFTANGTIGERKGHILSLFNSVEVMQDSTLMMFAQDVIEYDYKIVDGENSNTLAVATFAYKDIWGDTFPVRLVLFQSVIDGAPVWFVGSAESPYFTYGNKENPYYINFSQRELGFMELEDEPDRSAESMTGRDYKGDDLAVFLLLKSKGLITYMHSEKVQFICAMGEYMFLVEYVESYEHIRSGYLITRLTRNGILLFENRP